MKNIICAILLLGSSLGTYAQCDKHVLLSSSKTEYVDAAGTVERSVDEKSTVEINKDTIIIAPGHEPRVMTGTIVSQTCNWTVPFKEGKSVMKVRTNSDGGEARNLTITIEGKDGKLTLLAVIDEMPDRQIRVPIDSFTEKS